MFHIFVYTTFINNKQPTYSSIANTAAIEYPSITISIKPYNKVNKQTYEFGSVSLPNINRYTDRNLLSICGSMERVVQRKKSKFFKYFMLVVKFV